MNIGNRALNHFISDSIKNKSYLDSTESYLAKAKQFIQENAIVPNQMRQRQILLLEGNLLYRQKNYSEARTSYQKALEVSESTGDKKRVYQLKFRMAECYFYMEEYLKAKALFDSISPEDLEQYKLLKNRIMLNFYYAEIYLSLEEYKKALEYSNIYNTQTEKFYQEMTSKKADLLIQRELEEKKQILEKLRKKSEENEVLKTYGWIAFLSLLIIVLILSFYIREQRKRFRANMKRLMKRLEKPHKKTPHSVQVDEKKAQKILEELKKIEEQELFLLLDYSLNMVAKRIDSNSSYVSQIINRYWEKSFVQYTNELRINYILLKLKEDTMYRKFTLTAIAESAGYKSVISFNKHFKGVTGITPRQYLQYLRTL